MTIPKIDVFSTPYRIYSYRSATHDEMITHYNATGYMRTDIPDELLKEIKSALDAANHIASVFADNGLENHIDNALSNSKEFKNALSMMPSKTPAVLLDQKMKSNPQLQSQVDIEINKVGDLLSDGQYIFHGGAWNHSLNTIQTTRPLSTSFCPQVALRNAEHKGKAFHGGKIDLLAIKVTNAQTKAFIYNRKGSLSHEKEVLFSAGAKITINAITLITTQYPSSLDGVNFKHIPIYVIQADIS